MAGLTIENNVVRPSDETRRRIYGYIIPIAFIGMPQSDQIYGSNPVPPNSLGYFVKNVRIKNPDGYGAGIYSSELSIMEDSEYTGSHGALEAGRSKLVRFRNNVTSNTMRPAAYFYTARSWFENNTLTGVDYETFWPTIGFRYNESTGTIEHRYADFSLAENYVANNRTLGVFGSATGNEGEGLLWQGASRLIYSNLTSAGAQALTDTTAAYTSTYVGRFLTVLNGNGIGQLRKITGFSGSTLQLDRPWDIVPDAGSAYTVDSGPAYHNIVVNNRLDGQTNKGGIMFYTKDYDNIIDGNILTHTGESGLPPTRIRTGSGRIILTSRW